MLPSASELTELCLTGFVLERSSFKRFVLHFPYLKVSYTKTLNQLNVYEYIFLCTKYCQTAVNRMSKNRHKKLKIKVCIFYQKIKDTLCCNYFPFTTLKLQNAFKK